jgi:hypothetical protein
MSAQPNEPEPDRPLTGDELEAIGLYLRGLRRYISDQSILNTSLVIAFVSNARSTSTIEPGGPGHHALMN